MRESGVGSSALLKRAGVIRFAALASSKVRVDTGRAFGQTVPLAIQTLKEMVP
jgi:hypothetical protein